MSGVDGSRHGLAAMGASTLVLAVTGCFYVYAVIQGRSPVKTDYQLDATFLSANGLKAGADVLLAGVAVGAVTSVTLDERTMLSQVRFRIDRQLHLPVDTRLAIGSSTLTSADALQIVPGKADQKLVAGATITDTCGTTSLEQQVSQYIFGSGGAPSSCGS